MFTTLNKSHTTGKHTLAAKTLLLWCGQCEIRWGLHSSSTKIFPGRTADRNKTHTKYFTSTKHRNQNIIKCMIGPNLNCMSAQCVCVFGWHGNGQSDCLAAVAISAGALSQANWTACSETCSRRHWGTIKEQTNVHYIYIYTYIYM